MKRLMTGMEALARGAAEKRVALVVGRASRAPARLLDAAEREGLDVQRAPTDAVALEVAFGASQAGARAIAVLDTLDGAAEVLQSASYIGPSAGLALVVVDDPGLTFTEVERDSRVAARALKLPCLEPADAPECVHHVAAALGLSERWDMPVVVRLTTRVAFGARPVSLRAPAPGSADGLRVDREHRVLTPGQAPVLRARVAERLGQLAAYAGDTPLNRVERRSRALGVVTSGAVYHHVREVLPDASILKLGMSFPVAGDVVRDFAALVDRVVVVEELEPVLEAELRDLGVACRGKDLVPRTGEISPDLVARALLDGYPTAAHAAPALAPRPPELCPGCPQRAVIQALKRLHVNVIADAGCAALGGAAPLRVVDVALHPGAAPALAHGAEAVLGSRVRGRMVAVVSEGAFVASGAVALSHAAAGGSGGTLVVVRDGSAEPSGVDVAALARAVGAARLREVDAYDLAALEGALRDELGRPELSVVLASAHCRSVAAPRGGVCRVDEQRCNRCGACLRLGCPALSDQLDTMAIDGAVCAGCGLCRQVCRAQAIVWAEEVPACRA